MSVRDYAVLYLGGARPQRSTAGGGNTLLRTDAHRLDGPEHTEASDSIALDASDTAHGLLPKLSGDPADALRGDGTFGPTPDLVAGIVPYTELGTGGDGSGENILHDDGTWSPETPASSLTIKDEGTPLATAATSIDFVGTAVVASGATAAKTVTVSAELPIEGGQSTIAPPHGSMGSTETFDPTDGNVHTGTLNANCTFTLNAPAGSGACTLELRLAQDGTGGWAITWPGSVTLVGTLDTTASTTAIVILETLDGGTSWVAVVVGSGSTFATPAIALGSSAAAGVATTVIRSDSTIAAFDATAPTTQAIGDSAVVGTAAFAARRDHKHAMPSFGSPVAVSTANSDGVATTVARSDHVHQGATGSLEHVHVMDCLFSGDGSTTAFTLPAAPYDQYSVAAYVSGVLTEVTLSGDVFDIATFGSAPASATNNIRFDIYAATV